VDTASDKRLLNEWAQLPLTLAAHAKKVGDGSQGFFVPRYDPACGTGGFLTAAANVLAATRMVDHGLGRGRRKLLAKAVDRGDGMLLLIDGLDEAIDDPLSSHLIVLGGTAAADFDASWGNLLVQCKHRYLPVASSADLVCLRTVAAAEPGAYW